MAYILNSPVFTGNPTGPTPATADNSVSLATTAYVKNQGYGVGTVTGLTVTTANGVSGSFTGAPTPALTLTLGAITPTSVNGLTISTTAGTLTVANNAAAVISFSGNFAQTFTASAASSVTMPASTTAVMDYYVSGTPPSQYAISYTGTASTGLMTPIAPPTVSGIYLLQSNPAGSAVAPTWTSAATGSGAPVFGTSPTISALSLSGTSAITGGTTTVNSGATVNVASGGSLTIASGATFTSANTPANANDVTNKAYVDATVQGLSQKPTAALATSGILNATQNYTYNNGTAGVGATLTNNGTQAALVIDSITVTVGQIILVKNEITYPQYNGLYTVTTVGTGATNWVLTRHTQMDSTAEFQGAFIPVGDSSTIITNGTQTFTVNVGSRTIILSGSGTLNWTTLGVSVGQSIEMAGWTSLTNNNQSGFVVQSITTSSATNDTLTWTVGSVINSPAAGAQTGNISVYITSVTNDNTLWLCETTGSITVGTTPVTFIQLNSATSLTAGTGISISGNTINTANIPNASLTNSQVTIGSTAVSLGATVTTFAGLVSVTSTTFVGALTGNASTATSINAGATNQVPYQTSANNTSFITLQNYGVFVTGAAGAPSIVAGAAGVLVGSTSVAPAWSTTPTLTGTNFSGTAASLTAGLATAVAGGSTNQVLYQSGAGVTAFATAGNYGVLTTGSSGVPVVTAGAAGVLVGSASAIPSWSTSPSISGANITATTIPIGSINATTTGSGTILTLATGPSISGATLTGTTTHTGGKILAAVAVAGYASINIAAAALNPTTQVTGDLWVNGTVLYYYNGTTNIPLSSSLVSPMTTLGDIIYGGASGAATRLAGNTTGNTETVLISTASSGVATAPQWTTTTGTAGTAVVLATSPTLVTPVLGAATATSINSLTISTSLGTLTIANNASAVISFSGNYAQTFTASAASSVTMPASTTAVMDYYVSGTPPSQYAISYTGTASTGLMTPLAPPTVTGNYVLISTPAGSAVAPAWSSASTGTGTIPVFQTSPTLITPALGVATATSINGLAITTTAATIALANSASASFNTSGNYSLTLTATAVTNATLPAGTTTLMANVLTNIGDLIYSSTTATPGAPARLASAAGVLYCTGINTAPTWSTSPTISGANISSGTIPWSAISATGAPAIVNTVTAGTTGLTTAYQYVLANAAGGTITLNLPTSPATGTQFTVKKIDTSANAVTISGGSAYVDSTSSTSVAISAQWNALTFTYNSATTTWYIS